MINKAIGFATLVHANQTRKETEIPYILHCLEAGTIAASLSTKDGNVNSDVVCSAILHDTLEDAHVSYELIKEMFNENIADLVNSQSEDKSKTWVERKEHTIEFLKSNKSKDVEIAYLSDKLSNMRSIYKNSKENGDKFWDIFNAGKESQYWYYNSISESFSHITDSDEYKEYKTLINKTFEN